MSVFKSNLSMNLPITLVFRDMFCGIVRDLIDLHFLAFSGKIIILSLVK